MSGAELKSMTATYDDNTRVTSVTLTANDLTAYYNQAEAARITGTATPTPKMPQPTAEPTPQPTVVPTQAPAYTAQPPLTSPPQVGTILAHVLVDPSLGAYNADGSVNWDNVSEVYKINKDDFGQCTWYATARFYEITGVNICDDAQNWMFYDDAKANWPSDAATGKYVGITGATDINAIPDRGIAVTSSHVMFIEYIERDANGNPVNVYYSDANHQGNGTYNPYGLDSKIQKITFTNFIRSNGGVIGYVFAK